MLPANAIPALKAALPIRLVRGLPAAAGISPASVEVNIFTILPTVNPQNSYQDQVAGVNIPAVFVHPASVREVSAVRNIIRRPVLRFAKRQKQITATTVPQLQPHTVVLNIGLTAHQNAKRLTMIIAETEQP